MLAPEPVLTPSAAFRVSDEPRSREVRLGLVMYGGVSLAVYINGVGREFFNAVRGRGVFRLVKAMTDSDIVVDVISGTSAGGINGIMLAYALCNGRDFAATAQLWRQHGGIQNLLRAPTDANAVSVLDSEGYYEPHLREAFASMPEISASTSRLMGEAPSAFSELDLFVTGTDVDGERYTQFDDAGHPISVKNHRGVFLLKHREGRKEPFRPDGDPASPHDATHAALARLSRLTSCFPGAFAPVHVTGADEAGRRLQTWGQLRPEAWFLDGGVLDNKPFTLTLEAIFSRTADRDVDRKLFYVEPDPEAFDEAERAQTPNVVQAVLQALIGIPGYESISEDLKRLNDHNTKVERYARITEDTARHQRVMGVAAASHPTARRIYERTRLTVISDRVVEGLFQTGGRKRVLTPDERVRAGEIVRAFDEFVEPQVLFTRIDVYFPQRRLYRLIYLIFGLVNRPSPGEELPSAQADAYRQLWRVLNRQLRLYEVIESAMHGLIDRLDMNWQGSTAARLWETLADALEHLLATDAAHPFQQDAATRLPDSPGPLTPEGWLPSATLSAYNSALKARRDRLVEAIPQAPHSATNLIQQAHGWDDEIVAAFVPDADDAVRQAFDDFEALDEVLYPLEIMSGTGERDVIETVRLSPKDANRGFSANSLANKVSGDTVYHFGGFFKRSWRANDILWGRLDGVCQLVETLVQPDRLATIAREDGWRARVRAELYDGAALRPDFDPARLFPQSGAASQAEFAGWLDRLFSDDGAARGQALAETDRMVTLLVEMAQLEILAEELPNVIGDALDEQNEWNRFPAQETPAAPGVGEPPWVYRTTGKKLDPFVAAVASAQQSRKAFDGLVGSGEGAAEPRQTPLGRFFLERYRVGAEEVGKDIPSVVLMDVMASALLVVKNCILAAFGDDAYRIRAHPLYRYTIALPLRVFYGLAKLSRRVPGLLLVVGVTVVLLCALALTAAYVWFDALVFTSNGLDRTGLVVFVLVPAFLLVGLVVLLGWAGRWFGGLRRGGVRTRGSGRS